MKWDKELIINEIKNLEIILGRKPVKRDSARIYSISRKYFGTWNNMMEVAGYNIKKHQKPQIPDLNLDDTYYFLGLLCTDGHIQIKEKGGKYKLVIFTSYEEEMKMIVNLIKYLFNYDASIRIKNYGFSIKPNFEIYISSKEICNFFCSLGVPHGNKSLSINVPNILFNVENKKVISFIRGVFDGDGSIIFSKNTELFKISSGSSKFIYGIEKLLINQGISFIRITNERHNLWELKLSKSKEIKKLYDLLYINQKFYYPRKRLKWSNRYI